MKKIALQPLFGGASPFGTEWPPAPPWRRFSGVALADDSRPELSARDAVRADSFQSSDSVERAVEAALILRRPLLVRGLPGVGKSTLAYAVARTLGLGAVLRWNITSRSTLAEGLYHYDVLARLNDFQFKNRDEPPAIEGYLRLGPLGTALLPWTKPRVLLIDELDKSDIDLPNDLLHLFEEGSFPIPELERDERPSVSVTTADGATAPIPDGKVVCREFPFVVITSNGEREFSPALLRRCVQYEFQEPDEKELRRIIEVHLGSLPSGDRDKVIQEFLARKDQGGRVLATDQLLNALYVLQGRQPESDTWKALCDIVLTSLDRSESE